MMMNELKVSLGILSLGQTFLYPTDTVWGIGCDATNKNAVSKIFKIKNRDESKSLVILVNSFEMLELYIAEIPELVKTYLLQSKGPTTVIYRRPKGLASNAVSNDNTVAIRIVKDEFCQRLIRELGKPIVSTSANISGDATPKSFSEISKSILDSVDYIVDLHKEQVTSKVSSIVRLLDDDTIEVIRD